MYNTKMPAEQVIENYSKQFMQEIQKRLDSVNASVARLMKEEYICDSSYIESCKALKEICKEYKDFLLWKNKMKRTIPMEFLFLERLKENITTYNLKSNTNTLELENPVCLFNEEKLRLLFIYEIDSVTVALNFRYVNFKDFSKTMFFKHIWSVFRDIHPECELTTDGIYAHYNINLFKEDLIPNQTSFICNNINHLRTNCKYFIV